MKKKVDIRKKIKVLSWTSVIGLLVITISSVYNTIIYIKNLAQMKTIVELINKDTSVELKKEVIETILSNMDHSQVVLLVVSFIGIGVLFYVIYLGATIKKETDKRIHAMDWIIE